MLTEGRKYNAEKALELGLVHDLAQSKEELIEKAIEWINSNPQVQQPWDTKAYRLPGGLPSSPKLAPILAIAPALIRKKTKGVFPAPELILATMVEGALVDFDTASRIESRHFVELVCSPISKNMINTFWYQLNSIKSGLGRPQDIAKRKSSKKLLFWVQG